MKYIAAFTISTRSCDCGTLIEEILPIDNPETLEDCTDADKKTGTLCGWYEASEYLKKPYGTEMEPRFRYLTFKKKEMILVSMPPGLAELLTYLPDMKALRANADSIQRAVRLAHPSNEIGTVGS